MEYKYERKTISDFIYGRIYTAYNNISGIFDNIRTNKEKQGMTFSTALELLKYGLMVSREAWDNAEFYLYYDKEEDLIYLHKDDEEACPMTLLNICDILAHDWYLVF